MAKAYKCDQCGALIEKAYTSISERETIANTMCYITFRLTESTEYENRELVKGGEAELCLNCAYDRLASLGAQIQAELS